MSGRRGTLSTIIASAAAHGRQNTPTSLSRIILDTFTKLIKIFNREKHTNILYVMYIIWSVSIIKTKDTNERGERKKGEKGRKKKTLKV